MIRDIDGSPSHLIFFACLDFDIFHFLKKHFLTHHYFFQVKVNMPKQTYYPHVFFLSMLIILAFENVPDKGFFHQHFHQDSSVP